MGFTSFAGRVLFSAIFILAAYEKISEFDQNGGAALQFFQPKYTLFKQHVLNTLGLRIPELEPTHVLITAIALESLGAILFIFGSTLGAYLLLLFLAAITPVIHDFYNYDLADPVYTREFGQFLKNLSLFGALLFYLGMKNSHSKKIKKKQQLDKIKSV